MMQNRAHQGRSELSDSCEKYWGASDGTPLRVLLVWFGRRRPLTSTRRPSTCAHQLADWHSVLGTRKRSTGRPGCRSAAGPAHWFECLGVARSQLGLASWCACHSNKGASHDMSQQRRWPALVLFDSTRFHKRAHHGKDEAPWRSAAIRSSVMPRSKVLARPTICTLTNVHAPFRWLIRSPWPCTPYKQPPLTSRSQVNLEAEAEQSRHCWIGVKRGSHSQPLLGDLKATAASADAGTLVVLAVACIESLLAMSSKADEAFVWSRYDHQ